MALDSVCYQRAGMFGSLWAKTRNASGQFTRIADAGALRDALPE